jgi:hypothetical protein
MGEEDEVTLALRMILQRHAYLQAARRHGTIEQTQREEKDLEFAISCGWNALDRVDFPKEDQPKPTPSCWDTINHINRTLNKG